jgi:membrane protein
VLQPREAWGLARRAVQGWIDDSASSMGAALAFYSLLSLAPLLLVVIGVAGVFWGRTEAQALLMDQVTTLVGDSAAAGIQLVLENAGSDATEGVLPAVIGFATALFGAATVFNELQLDLDRIWRHHARKTGVIGMLRSRALTFGMVLAVGFLLLVSLVVSTAISALSNHWLAGSLVGARALEFVLSFSIVTGLFAMIYKILPRTRIAWGDVWVGAAVTSALFWIGKYLIGLYIGHATVANSFGAAGTVVVLIVWVYYSAQVFFLGAEFTREYALRHGSRCGTVQGRKRAMEAANEDEMVERAKGIAAGNDPILLRRPGPTT